MFSANTFLTGSTARDRFDLNDTLFPGGICSRAHPASAVLFRHSDLSSFPRPTSQRRQRVVFDHQVLGR